MTGRLIQIAWELGAVTFLALVVLAIRKARARGKRLFVDLPMKRLGPPPDQQPQIDHRWDAL